MGEQIIRVAIDFGSTVTAMGWQLMERSTENNGWCPVAGFCWKKTFPTIILLKSRNPGALFEKDLYGEDALKALRKANAGTTDTSSGSLVAETGFKGRLFSDDKTEQKEAVRLTTQFFRYLRTVFETQHTMSEEDFHSLKKEVYITKPLISTLSIDELLLSIAQRAGFDKQHGYDGLYKYDEVRSLADLASSDDKSDMCRIMIDDFAEEPEVPRMALFVDIGGLTADVTLALIRQDERGDFCFQQLGMWPAPGDHLSLDELGGGIILDKAISRWMMDKEFVNKEAVARKVEQQQYLEFADFKIWANEEFWREGQTPFSLNGLGIDIDQELFAPKDYALYQDEWLTPEKFVQDVASDYIEIVSNGIQHAIQDGIRSETAREHHVEEKVIDYVFLTGGGSRIFFMEDLITRLTGLSNDRIFVNKQEVPTLSCVSGVLCGGGRMVLAANADYDIRLALYSKKLKFVRSDIPIVVWTIPLIRKGMKLPVSVPKEICKTSFVVTTTMSGLELNLSLLRGSETEFNDIDKNIPIETGKKAKTLMTDVAGIVGNTAKKAAPLALALLLEGAGRTVGADFREVGKQLQNAAKHIAYNSPDYYRKLDADRKTQYIDTVVVSYTFTVDKDRRVSGSVQMHSASMSDKEQTMAINLG